MQTLKSTILAAIVSAFIALPIMAQTKKGGNWTPLFNGKDLAGWKQLNGKAKYEVINNEIVGSTVLGEPNSFLVTEKNYGDFILELEFKLDDMMNSGIQFRSESKPDYLNGRVHGYQYEIDPSPRAWTAGIYDESRRDWLYPVSYNEPAKTLFSFQAWNTCRIECIGNSIRTFLNGKPVASLVDDLTPAGFIALQVHSIGKAEEANKKIRWRNIKIQTTHLQPTLLDPTFVVNLLPNYVSEQEKMQGVHLLFDGTTTNGWRGAYKAGFPDKGWKVQDGILTVQSSNGAESTNGGDIVSENEYDAFIFQFDFKLTAAANSGVKYFVTEQENNAGSAIGLEYQILDDALHPDATLGSIGNRTLGSLYDLIPAVKENRARRKIGEWNRGMVKVTKDGTVSHYLNGWKMLEYKRGEQYFYALVAKSKYANWPNFGMATKGRLLLQDHGNEVSFRSLKMQILK